VNTYFINLAQATGRRAFLERNFREFASPAQRLFRVEAVGIPELAGRGLAGSIRPSEIACLMSHRRAIAASLEDNDHSLIVEDDALFGPSTFLSLPALGALQDESVDLVFLSGLIGDMGAMLTQILMRRTLLERRQLSMMDVSKMSISGADAYIVKRSAKPRLLGLLDALASFDLPYDLQLRSWIHAGRLKAVLVFPTLTSLSPLADESGNGNANPTWHALNAFRRLLAVDSDHYPGDIVKAVDAIDPSFYDDEATRLAKVLRVLLSRNFVVG